MLFPLVHAMSSHRSCLPDSAVPKRHSSGAPRSCVHRLPITSTGPTWDACYHWVTVSGSSRRWSARESSKSGSERASCRSSPTTPSPGLTLPPTRYKCWTKLESTLLVAGGLMLSESCSCVAFLLRSSILWLTCTRGKIEALMEL